VKRNPEQRPFINFVHEKFLVGHPCRPTPCGEKCSSKQQGTSPLHIGNETKEEKNCVGTCNRIIVASCLGL
jgi:hypothetical protein